MKEVAEVMDNSCECGSEETGSENWSEIITMKLTHETRVTETEREKSSFSSLKMSNGK